MYVQVFQGPVSDAESMRAHLEEWVRTLGPGASGWLGSTTGVTEEGDAIALARFESVEAAQRNSDRPEQGEWWSRMATLFDEEPTFMDGTRVEVDLVGDPDEAGFVQVMQGRSRDIERAHDLMTAAPTALREPRPDILGRVWAADEEGRWTMAIYFTSEEAARAGEQREMSADMAALMDELGSLESGEPTYFDLREPWFSGP